MSGLQRLLVLRSDRWRQWAEKTLVSGRPNHLSPKEASGAHCLLSQSRVLFIFKFFFLD